MDRHAFSVAFNPGQIDREAGVIRGVAVMTEGIANGLVVDSLTLQQVKHCSETYANGLKVVDRHTKGTDSVFATVGSLKNFRIEGAKLLADLFALKSEANTAKLMEMAETIPDTFGLSVAFSGLNEVVGGIAHARCAEIYNAALVDVPAANPGGLFSANLGADPVPALIAQVDAPAKDKAMAKDTTIQPTLEARLEKLEAALTEMQTKMAAVVNKPAEPDGDEPTASDMAEAKKAITELSAQVKTLTELSDKISDQTAFAQTIADITGEILGHVVHVHACKKTHRRASRRLAGHAFVLAQRENHVFNQGHRVKQRRVLKDHGAALAHRVEGLFVQVGNVDAVEQDLARIGFH